MTGTERENRQQSEQLAALQSDKDQLEGTLYEAQQAVVQLEVRKAQLEGENQELIVRKENLQGEGGRAVNTVLVMEYMRDQNSSLVVCWARCPA